MKKAVNIVTAKAGVGRPSPSAPDPAPIENPAPTRTNSEGSNISQVYGGREKNTISNDDAEIQTPLRFRLNAALSALSASPEQDWVAVAGREVLKIISVYDSEVKEVLNLRGGIKLSLNFSINDVKWGNSFARSTIATAATNGAVVVWDLNRPNVQKLERILTEHTRAVNRISFHPTEPVLLLSASQDGNMRLWDLRAKSIARNAFEGKAESVRDVQFSPVSPFEFVAAFENGTIQKWDIRYPSTYERKWSAHNGLALTVDWHADGRWVASGGRDRQIKIWDMKSESRKPLHAIQTIAPVSRVQWRPGHETQLASCALSTDFRIHVWDVGRPFIPQYSLEAHEGVISGFLWRNPNSIWSCSKDRSFARHDIRTGYKPLSLVNTCAMNWNVQGDVTFAIDERRQDSADDYQRTLTTPGLAPGALRRPFLRPATLDRIPTEDRIPQYRPRQRTGVADTETFDTEAFVALADEYCIDSEDVWAACRHNAEVAVDLDLPRAAQTWKMLQLFYGTPSCGPRNLSQIFGRSKPAVTDSPIKPAPPSSTPLKTDINPIDSFQSPKQHHIGSAHSDSILLNELKAPKSDQWAFGKFPEASSFDRYDTRSDADKISPTSKSTGDDSRDDEDSANDGNTTENGSKSAYQGMDGYTDEEDDEDDDMDTPDDSDDSASSFTFGLKVGAGRKTLARFGIGTSNIWKSFQAAQDKRRRESPKTSTTGGSGGGGRGTIPGGTKSGQRGTHTKVGRTAVDSKGFSDVIVPSWNTEGLVKEMLEFYADQGNVQMCVTILLVLKSRIQVSPETEELWFSSYIDLLHRMKCWIAAAAIIKACTVPSVRARNQESTMIHTLCAKCGKPMINMTTPNWCCDECGKLQNPCSFCHETVKGLYAWCQGCSHGGHVDCFEGWFAESLECCTGCGHQCVTRYVSYQDLSAIQ
ncbi:WD40-repeat-containing domain protein [Phlyctochytrium arcticum]|nr:WD40-repeat-containing domain protein [Phlyctochytrium arcticum]